jgi:hypothetical protein
MAITIFPDAHLIELLDRIAAQDEAALRELYDITSKKLYGLALKMVGQHEYAEEVLQECYHYCPIKMSINSIKPLLDKA